jgi:hypothetical protein
VAAVPAAAVVVVVNRYSTCMWMVEPKNVNTLEIYQGRGPYMFVLDFTYSFQTSPYWHDLNPLTTNVDGCRRAVGI